MRPADHPRRLGEGIASAAHAPAPTPVTSGLRRGVALASVQVLKLGWIDVRHRKPTGAVHLQVERATEVAADRNASTLLRRSGELLDDLGEGVVQRPK